MTREEAKEWLPIIQAWAEGKTIQYQINQGSRWTDIINDLCTSNPPSNYRIKPEPNYRPFKNAEECWNEMLKHQPFGWVRCKDFTITCYTDVFTSDEVRIFDTYMHFPDAFKQYEFINGTPFGIKED